MRRALAKLAISPAALLVDGFEIPACDAPQRALVKGDARSLSIAAASIIAKVERDRIMVRLDELHPEYDLRAHKGYPTAAHLRALAQMGPSPLHRMTFAPVRAAKTCLTALAASPKV
jgi:ribonuclease HII